MKTGSEMSDRVEYFLKRSVESGLTTAKSELIRLKGSFAEWEVNLQRMKVEIANAEKYIRELEQAHLSLFGQEIVWSKEELLMFENQQYAADKGVSRAHMAYEAVTGQKLKDDPKGNQ
jgi:hypothetical protein